MYVGTIELIFCSFSNLELSFPRSTFLGSVYEKQKEQTIKKQNVLFIFKTSLLRGFGKGY